MNKTIKKYIFFKYRRHCILLVDWLIGWLVFNANFSNISAVVCLSFADNMARFDNINAATNFLSFLSSFFRQKDLCTKHNYCLLPREQFSYGVVCCCLLPREQFSYSVVCCCLLLMELCSYSVVCCWLGYYTSPDNTIAVPSGEDNNRQESPGISIRAGTRRYVAASNKWNRRFDCEKLKYLFIK